MTIYWIGYIFAFLIGANFMKSKSELDFITILALSIVSLLSWVGVLMHFFDTYAGIGRNYQRDIAHSLEHK